MTLAQRNFGVGDTRRVAISYKQWLATGAVLASVAVSIVVTVPPATSTVQNATLSPDRTGVYFYVTMGVVNEQFTVVVTVTDTNGQVVSDTVDCQVVPS